MDKQLQSDVTDKAAGLTVISLEDKVAKQEYLKVAGLTLI